MIVLDASVLIAHLDASDGHHEKARSILLETGTAKLGASAITVAEVLVAPARQDRLEEALEALERLGVEQIPPGEHIAGRLATLRAETGLKMPDCCVLQAAESAGGKVVTFDAALAKAAAKLGLSN